jgi:hypothetical protein
MPTWEQRDVEAKERSDECDEDDSLAAEAEDGGCVVYAGEDGVVAADAARISVSDRKGPHRVSFVALFHLDVRIGGKVSDS